MLPNAKIVFRRNHVRAARNVLVSNRMANQTTEGMLLPVYAATAGPKAREIVLLSRLVAAELKV